MKTNLYLYLEMECEVIFMIQIINVYVQEYESGGAFWPHIHGRIIACVIIQQVSLFGIMATKKAKKSTPLLLLLPVLTIAFHLYCKNRFEPAFRKYPLEVSRCLSLHILIFIWICVFL